MRRVLSLAAIVLVSLALVAAGCGGDDGTETSSPTEWAEAFCGATNTWLDELQRIGSDLTSSPTAEGLEQAAEELDTATDAYVDEVEGLGGPDTEGGDEIEEATQEFTDAVDEQKAEVDEAVEDASDATGVAGALAAVGGAVQALGGALQTLLQTIENADVSGELETAFEDAEACSEIGQ
jgi:hypothetical protein